MLEEHIRESLVPQCYVSFTGLVRDTQFARLGITLVGLLSGIAVGANGVGLLKVVHENFSTSRRSNVSSRAHSANHKESSLRKTLFATSTRVTGEDQGEVIDRVYDSGDGVETDMDAGGDRDELEGPGSAAEGSMRLVQDAKTEMALEVAVKGRVTPELVLASGPLRQEEEEASTTSTKDDVPAVKNKKKTKKKKGKNALDALFSGLM